MVVSEYCWSDNWRPVDWVPLTMSLYVSTSEYETEFLKVSMHTSQHIHQMRERHEMRVQVCPGKGMTCSFALLLTFSVPLRSISF